ncbi:MAG: hypothetical protein A2283_22550 [Lentisphaerae bacterium RIFOXYA12_FULL_48_11]|nr:MAG: hypothetical protein A2283_22550 [Lentisphaerae bacterium RIFOXYA12_FULL_48_11]
MLVHSTFFRVCAEWKPQVAFRRPNGPEKRHEDFAMPARRRHQRDTDVSEGFGNNAGAQKTHTGFTAKCHLLTLPPTNMTYSQPASIRAK